MARLGEVKADGNDIVNGKHSCNGRARSANLPHAANGIDIASNAPVFTDAESAGSI